MFKRLTKKGTTYQHHILVSNAMRVSLYSSNLMHLIISYVMAYSWNFFILVQVTPYFSYVHKDSGGATFKPGRASALPEIGKTIYI